MVTLRRGIPLMVQQVKALLWKNLSLATRSKRSTLLQIIAPFIFLFLLFAGNKSRNFHSTPPVVRDPPTVGSTVLSIPSCETRPHMRRSCYDFVWSGNSSRNAQLIVSRIMANNPGRHIPSYKVRSFGTPAEVDAWLFNEPLRCTGALHFFERSTSVMSYGIQINYTTSIRDNSVSPILQFQIPLQIAAEREIARSLLADQNFSWNVGLKQYPQPAQPHTDASSSVNFDFGTLAPMFLFTIAMFPFVFQISSIVLEKELKLRQAMNIMGLYDSAYWLSWLVWETFVILISTLCTVFSGMILQFPFFLHNSFAILFFLFFIFQLNMTGFAFMISAFLGKSSSAFRAGFWVFLIGFILQIAAIVVSPSKKSNKFYYLPPSLLTYGIQMLVESSDDGPGISWSKRTSCPADNSGCYLTMNDIYMRLIYTFVCWFLLALYLDNVLPSPNSTSKSILYFLDPRYWAGKEGNKHHGGICGYCNSEAAIDNITPDDEDVLEEENAVKQEMRSDEINPNIAVQIRGLAKIYPGKLNFGCCCKCNKTDPFHAIKGLYVNLPKDQLFCLLGPNGAGKTTTINCLTGITSVTAGDAIIYGYSIRNSVGMSSIRKIIGVCPQFDILWNAMTGEEHLHLFARIKGLLPASIKEAVKKSLEEVRLINSAKVRAGSYSGGMRRRLSVASAFLGDPKLVILDEPTTGMDPISRRHVWDIIENAKRERVIILTTHSMEEADILGDRIGIMAKGRLRCIGTSIRLKSRFGTGFIANLSFVNGNSATNSSHKETVKKFFRDHLGIFPKEESNTFLTFVIPRQKEPLLKGTLGELHDKQHEFGIADIQLGLTTLEEVFLNIARQAELETAAAEGRMETLTLSSGTLVQIPVGARYVAIPGTETAENPRGIMVEIYWEQNDSGALCISGHSTERPVPPNVQPSLPVINPRSLGQPNVIVGRVIDPSQISETGIHLIA